MIARLPSPLFKFFGGAVLSGWMIAGASAATNSYSTAGTSTFTVPANVNSIQVTLTGAAGGSGGSDGSNSGGSGGPAGRVTGTVAVIPGDTLYFHLGGAGANGTNSTSAGGGGAGGSNAAGRVSAGNGGAAGSSGSSGAGGGGGGSAYFRKLSGGVTTDVAEAGGAGGGGGAGNTSPNQAGLNGTTGSYVLQYTGSAGTDRGSGNDGGGGGGGGTGKRGGAGGGLRTSGNTDSGGNGGNAGDNDTTGLTGASASFVTVSAGAAASATIVYTALPSAPVISSSAQTDTSVTLAWTAPSSGPTITDYIVQYRLAGASSWNTFADATSATTGATVTGLNHSSSYEFQVAAVNGDGTGSYSSILTVATKKNFVLTLSAPASSFTLLGSAVAVDSSLTIVDETSTSISAAKVQISSGFQTGDTLSLPTGGAAAAFPGITGSYNLTNGILTLSGSGTASVYQAALRAVTFSTTNTSTAARTMDVTLGNAISYGSHFYEVVTNSVTWANARSGALAKSLFGIPGYLVNITSLAENQFILSKISTTAWIGAADIGTEGTWKWMDGPEAGTTFWIGTGTGSAQGGQFTNWNTNEPNDSGGAEDGASIYSGMGASDGKWNDYGGSGPYIVEYGNPNAVITFSGTKTLSIQQASQTITFNALPIKTYGDGSFNLSATGGASGNAVTYTSSNTNVATISGSTVTIVGVGTTSITANQAGNTTYGAASPVSQNLTVNQATQTINFGSLGTKSYGAAAFSAGATASSGLPVSYTSSNPYVATVSGGTITIVGVGTTVITASQTGNSNYLPATPATQTLTVQSTLSSVDGATILLDFQVADTTAPLSHANGWSSNDTEFRPDGYADDSVNTNNVLGMIGGFNNAPANATTELKYNFTSASTDRYVFSWNQSISSSSSTFPGDDIFGWKFLSGANTAFSLRFLNDNSTGRDLLVQGYDGAGNALTLGSGQPNDWYIDRDDANDFRVTADLATKKWALDVFNKSNNTWFGLVADAAISPSITSLDGIAATWTVADSNFDADAGQYLGAGDNIMAFDNLTLQGKQTVVIDLNLPSPNPTYNGLSHMVTPTTTPSGVALVVKYNGSTTPPVNAGTYTVTAEVVDTNSYYNAPTTGTLVVEKKTVTVTADNQTMEFGATVPSLTFQYAGFVLGEDETYLDAVPTASTIADSSSPVGFYSIEISSGSDDNYEINPVAGLLEITPANIPPGSISLTPPANFMYDGNPKIYTVVNSFGSPTPDVQYSGRNSTTYGDSNPPTNAGDYTITVTVIDPNYAFAPVSEDFTITKATPANVTAPTASDITLGQDLGQSGLSGGSAEGVDGTPLAGTFTFDDATIVPSSTGSYSAAVTFTPSDATNYETVATTVTVTVNSADTPWDTWADGFGLANGTARAKNSDPDGDGLSNALEFAFGLNPTAREAAVFTAVKSGSNYLVTFKKRKLAAEATYDFRSSTLLSQPFSAGTPMTPGSATSVNANYEQVTVTLPISGTRGFVRGQATILVDPSR